MKNNKSYQAAYWKAFEEFFGPNNAPVVKAMLLARTAQADTGAGELDRACFGLRQTMSWLAEAIERKALANVGNIPRERRPKGPATRSRSSA